MFFGGNNNTSRFRACVLFVPCANSQLTGNESAIVRIKYQLDDIHGNEILGDPDLRNETLKVVIDE